MICLNDNEIIIYANDDKILYVNDTEKVVLYITLK